MAQISVATRLAAYGLTEDQVKLSNLRLENNQTRVVSYSTMPDQVIQLQPQTVHQLKSWVGVPDAAFAHLSPPSIPAPAIHLRKVDEGTTTEEHAALSAAAREFVFRHSSAISEHLVPVLNDWVQLIKVTIHLVGFNDIHLSAGSQLVIAPDVFILFAQSITIEDSASIQVPGGKLKIDAVSITSTSPFLNLPRYVFERHAS